mmetsp:Transcript_20117/g.19077  ORF Transcript_20117/g.19077 Transcript_20117/m.19077 type:complete len:278 (+) Transcript_20117:437-1270(+)
MDSNSHVEIFEVFVGGVGSDLGDDVDHLKAGLDDSVGFLGSDLLCPILRRDVPCVPRDHVAVADGVHLVDMVVHAELVELREQLRQQLHHLLRILDVVAELGEAAHVGEEEGDVLQLVHHLVPILDSLQHRRRHQIAQQLIGPFVFHIKHLFSVVVLPATHVSGVGPEDHHRQQEQLLEQKRHRPLRQSSILGSADCDGGDEGDGANDEQVLEEEAAEEVDSAEGDHDLDEEELDQPAVVVLSDGLQIDHYDHHAHVEPQNVHKILAVFLVEPLESD